MKPGPTGQFPNGKINDYDDGEIAVKVGCQNNIIVIEFGTPIQWFGMPKKHAQVFIEILKKYLNELKD